MDIARVRWLSFETISSPTWPFAFVAADGTTEGIFPSILRLINETVLARHFFYYASVYRGDKHSVYATQSISLKWRAPERKEFMSNIALYLIIRKRSYHEYLCCWRRTLRRVPAVILWTLRRSWWSGAQQCTFFFLFDISRVSLNQIYAIAHVSSCRTQENVETRKFHIF